MCGTETANFLNNFLISKNLKTDKKSYGEEKIFLSEPSSKFIKIAENILNEEVKIVN